MSRFVVQPTRLLVGAILAVCVGLLATAVFMIRQPVNPVNASLDTLAGVSIGERWSHPEMAKIREMGTEGLQALRRTLREQKSIRTRLLLWVGARFPAGINYIPNYPNPGKMQERRWAACQALKQLGPVAQSVVPDLVELLRDADISTGNQVTMALFAIGVDADVIERLGKMLEEGGGGMARAQVLYLLAVVQPPTALTRKVLESALNDPNVWVQEAAVSVIARRAISTPTILARLKLMQGTPTNKALLFSATQALWALERKKEDVWLPTVTVLEKEVPDYTFKPFGGGSGGQGIDGPEMIYLKAASLWAGLELTGEEKQRALAVLNTFCEKSGRIFIRMSLLPDMMTLGLDLDGAADVCRSGLSAPEDYYNLQAARLVLALCDKWNVTVATKVSVPGMLGHADLGVQVCGAQFYWKTEGEKRRPEVILPVLLEALNAKKHQSYNYPEIQGAVFNLLSELGPAGRPALPALRELEKDVNPSVAKQAAQTREKIEVP